MRPCQGRVTGSSPVIRSLVFDHLLEPGHLAQLVERFVYIEDVGGPSPSVTTVKSPYLWVFPFEERGTYTIIFDTSC